MRGYSCLYNMLRLVVLACLFTACLACSSSPSPKCKAKRDELAKTTTLIVGGRDAKIQDFPYQLSLQFVYDNKPWFICGASIISTKWALTAAHCVVRNKQYQVRAGSSSPDRGGQVYSVARTIIHSKYSNLTDDYDIALLQIHDIFMYSSSVSFVKLPAQGQVIPKGETAIVSGWGRLSYGGRYPIVLQAVIVPVTSTEICEEAYGSDHITARMICAGLSTGGIDACQGDSGGPLVADHVQIGIVSWGGGCGHPNCYGVYTKVSEFRNWIMQTAGV